MHNKSIEFYFNKHRKEGRYIIDKLLKGDYGIPSLDELKVKSAWRPKYIEGTKVIYAGCECIIKDILPDGYNIILNNNVVLNIKESKLIFGNNND